MGLRGLGDELCQSGLPAPGRAPEDKREGLARFHDLPQYPSLPYEMSLADELGQALRPHPVGKRWAAGLLG
jgi:hypothetical protein